MASIITPTAGLYRTAMSRFSPRTEGKKKALPSDCWGYRNDVIFCPEHPTMMQERARGFHGCSGGASSFIFILVLVLSCDLMDYIDFIVILLIG